MADAAEALGYSIEPMQPVASPSMPLGVADLSRSSDKRSAPAAPAKEPNPTSISQADHVDLRTMIVGREISLSGDIAFCDRLVVEGNIEANLHECRELDISPTGLFRGNASIANAEVRGRFVGDLVVHKRLRVGANGQVFGTVTYGEIEIERGGKISGILMHEAKGARPL